MSTSVDTNNLSMLKELIGEDLKEIIQAYLDTTPDLLIKIEQALQAKNASQLQMNAHSLKGSSANIGALQLPGMCADLEQIGKSGVVTADANPLFSKIKMESQTVTDFLNNYMTQF